MNEPEANISYIDEAQDGPDESAEYNLQLDTTRKRTSFSTAVQLENPEDDELIFVI